MYIQMERGWEDIWRISTLSQQKLLCEVLLENKTGVGSLNSSTVLSGTRQC